MKNAIGTGGRSMMLCLRRRTDLNPNDLADYVRIKIKMDALLTRPIFNYDGALIMLTKNDENDLFLVTCKNAVEKQQINIDASDDFVLYETETGYLVWQYVDDKTSSFYWLNRKGIIEKQITVKDDITRVLSVDNHIIGWVNEKMMCSTLPAKKSIWMGLM